MFLTCTFVCACVRASVPCRRHSLTYLPPASHFDQTAELNLTSYRCRVSEMTCPLLMPVQFTGPQSACG